MVGMEGYFELPLYWGQWTHDIFGKIEKTDQWHSSEKVHLRKGGKNVLSKVWNVK